MDSEKFVAAQLQYYQSYYNQEIRKILTEGPLIDQNIVNFEQDLRRYFFLISPLSSSIASQFLSWQQKFTKFIPKESFYFLPLPSMVLNLQNLGERSLFLEDVIRHSNLIEKLKSTFNLVNPLKCKFAGPYLGKIGIYFLAIASRENLWHLRNDLIIMLKKFGIDNPPQINSSFKHLIEFYLGYYLIPLSQDINIKLTKIKQEIIGPIEIKKIQLIMSNLTFSPSKTEILAEF